MLRSGKIAKTHRGVRSEFSRLAKDDPRVEVDLKSFLAEAYKYKELGDYGVKTGVIITMQIAEDTIKTARRFIACVAEILNEP